MQNPQYGRPLSWQAQYGQPQLNGPSPYPPQRPVSNPNSPKLRPQQPYQGNYAPPYYPASTPSSRPISPYRPDYSYGNQPPTAPSYGPPPPQASPYLQPQTPQAYSPYRPPPPGYGYPPPPPQPAHGSYAPFPPLQAQHHQPHNPPSQVLLLQRESDETTLSLRTADGQPLYSCLATGRSSMSSKPDLVITRQPSGAAVGSVRFHYWLAVGLDYWEAGGTRGGAGLWAWRVEHADAVRAAWRVYRAGDLVGGRDPGACVLVARLTFDWAANGGEGRKGKKSEGVVVGRCEVYDTGLLLDPARRAEMDEFYVTAVVTVDAAYKALARRREEHGEIEDWEEFVEALGELAEAGGHGDGGGDGGGGDAGGGGLF
ncbi:hypothetical protein F4677DRAFT_458339 [Hypoxylon crocopeplum]|nr:hypothetical protein F4677DRAFT_458339 [Hypoxylon crocopeplum]